MRYIPSSRYTLDEIAEQCRAAIMKAQPEHNCASGEYNEVRKFFHYTENVNFHRMKDYPSLVR